MRYFNLEVEKAKQKQQQEQGTIRQAYVQKISEQVSKPMNSYGLIQKIRESEQKKPIIRNVLSPEESNERYEQMLMVAGLHADDELQNARSNLLKDRNDTPYYIDKLTSYSILLMRKLADKIYKDQQSGKRKENDIVNMNPTTELF